MFLKEKKEAYIKTDTQISGLTGTKSETVKSGGGQR